MENQQYLKGWAELTGYTEASTTFVQYRSTLIKPDINSDFVF